METRTLAYRFRLMPTPAQEQMFLQIAGCCRWVYNKALEAHQQAYRRDQQTLSGRELTKFLPYWKKEHAFLKTPPAQTLQAAIFDLHDGWSRFFKGQNDRPTWRKHGDDPRFRLSSPDQFKIKRYAGLKRRERFLYLPKMGMSGSLGPIKMVQHRSVDGKIKNLTIKREGQMWFASFITQQTVKPIAPFAMHAGAKVLGVDRGVRRPVATSDGVFLGTSVVTPELQAKQARLARAVSRKQEALRARHNIAPGGSLKGIAQPNALVRAKVRLAKFYSKMARKRKDQAHQISRALVNAADVVVFEALETKAMTSTQKTASSPRLRRAILDISWAQIESFTAYKAQWAGKTTVRVNPAYTSQTCSVCGYQHPRNRMGDAFVCRACGHSDDSDSNAARNIRRLGVAALQERALAPAAKPSRSRVAKDKTNSHGRVDAASSNLEGALRAPMKDKSSPKSTGVRASAKGKARA